MTARIASWIAELLDWLFGSPEEPCDDSASGGVPVKVRSGAAWTSASGGVVVRGPVPPVKI